MQFLENIWAQLLAVGTAMINAPGLFALAVLIFGPLIWLKYKVLGRAQRKAQSNWTDGFRTNASTRVVSHETGIGTKDVLVMRPKSAPVALVLGFLFFGGAAVFFWMSVLPSEPTFKNWFAFGAMCALAILVIAAFEVGQTRIILDEDGIEQRKILHKRVRILYTDVAQADLVMTSAAPNVMIKATDGRKIRVTSAFSGFVTLLERLGRRDPKLAAMAHMLKRRT